jgi:hypothetical protein
MGMFSRWHLATAVLTLGVVGGVAAAPAVPGRPGATPPRPAAPAPGPAAAGPIERTLVNPNSVVVYPFEKAPADKNAPPMLGEWIASQIRTGLDASGKYTAVLYYPNSPLVLRARVQGAVSQADIDRVIDPQRGVIDQDVAMRIANGIGTATAVLGSVEDYTYTPAANKVDVTATVQFLQVPSGTPIKTVGVTASATGPVGATQEAVAHMAAAEVAKKALSEMAVPPPPAPAATAAANKKNKKKQPAEGRSVGRKSGWMAVGALLAVLTATVR